MDSYTFAPLHPEIVSKRWNFAGTLDIFSLSKHGQHAGSTRWGGHFTAIARATIGGVSGVILGAHACFSRRVGVLGEAQTMVFVLFHFFWEGPDNRLATRNTSAKRRELCPRRRAPQLRVRDDRLRRAAGWLKRTPRTCKTFSI